MTLNITKLLKKFRKSEDGAVTVDWVVLTAAVVGLGVAALTLIGPAVKTMSTTISTDITNAKTATAIK